MIKTIWKYELIGKKSQINLPVDFKILTLQLQHGKPFIWVLVDPKKPMITFTFNTYGTGHKIVEDLDNKQEFIGTYQHDGGNLVWHVFKEVF